MKFAIAFLMTATLHGQMLRGVNMAGAEFGNSVLPGVFNTHYTFNSELSYRYFASRNLNLIRLPLQWERLQPTANGPLDAAYLERIKTTVGWAKTNATLLIPEIHNFGRYYGVITTAAQLADFWVRFSNEFRDEPTIYAYDLMNEPHDMTGWKTISQAALTAIRNNNDGKLIMVPGDSWSSANRWVTVHGATGWIVDPLNNFMYEAHLYFDSDESGSYKKTWEDELSANPNLPTIGVTRVTHFLDWLKSNQVRGYLGEYGVPGNEPRWFPVLDGFMKAVDAAGIPATCWAAGEWWGTSALNVQPTASFTTDRPQMSVLLQHLEPGRFTSVSAASSNGSTFAPGSFMAGYGNGLGASLELTDSSGAVLQPQLLYTSPAQINYRIPPTAALGRTDVAVKNGDSVVARGTVFLERTAPTLFSAIQIIDDTLVLYGTGFGNAVNPAGATLRVDNTPLTIVYVGPQPTIPGLDQINAKLPEGLGGTITFQIDGKTANPLTLIPVMRASVPAAR